MSASSWPEAAVPAVVVEEVSVPAGSVRWSIATRIAFRFFFVYLGIYNLSTVLSIFPSETLYALAQKYDGLWKAIVEPVGWALFGVATDVLPNGSGDTTFNYVQVFVFAALAAIATVAWSILDRRRLAYPVLFGWFLAYVRFSLAAAMIGYGVSKVIKLQFGNLLLDRLMQPFGAASPMGLLWTFMSFSVAYNFFTGASELLGGILLTARRTALLGALVTAGVMANIVMLNFTYDVPVKLYSSHLLLMAVFVAAPDAVRLAKLFVLNRPVPPAQLRPALRRRWLDVTVRVVRTLAVIAFVAWNLHYAVKARAEWDKTPLEQAPFYGVWNVDVLRADGVERPPLTTDSSRWRRLIVSSHRIVAFDRMDDTRQRYMMTKDANTITLKRSGPPASEGKFTYRQPDPSTLILDGTLDGRKIEATLRKQPLPELLLTTRGFHWINEYPYNR
jgi:hypothetical protein